MTDFTNVGRDHWSRGLMASQTAYVLLAFVLIAGALTLSAPAFGSAGNLYNVGKNFSFIAIVSLGVTLVIITGGIDLSVGSVMALTAIVTMILMRLTAGTFLAEVPGLALLASAGGGLGLAAFIGWINGTLIARVGLSPFVTTLGMLSICRGLCNVITEGRGQAPTGPDVDLFFMLTDARLPLAPGVDIPLAFIYLIALALLMAFALRQTAWGRHVFAIGGNERAAILTGVRVAQVKTSVYVLSSLSAGGAGLLMAGWLGSVPANLAFGYELRIIAASVIGGANLAGGVGGPSGAVLGAALIEVIRNGLVLGRVSPYWQETLVGAIIILAVLVDRFRARRGT